MSDFQIPGLGQAKPNETLPPLPADTVATPAASAGVEESNEPPHEATAIEPQEDKKEQTSTTGDNVAPETQQPDAMAIDRPESPPSLTHALEAAIGGLGGNPPAQQQPAQTEAQSQPAEGEVELQNDQGENPEWEIDSSPYESSSDSSSSDSSSDDDSDDNERYEPLSVEETARLLMEAEGGSDDEGDRAGKGGTGTQMRTKNELPDEVLPKPDVTITADMKVEELGSIEHIVENIMLVKAITPGEYQVLDTGSVLCTEDRVVIGVVAETIGKVLQPMYTVYFNSEDDIKQLGLQVGTKVYYPVEHASFVFTQPLKSLKGSDASNLHDEEVGDDEMEFSDDEKEAEYKRAIKQKKKDRWKSKNEGKAGSGSGGGSGQRHPLSQEMAADGGLNYDDDEGPYKPLARPPGFGSGPVSTESYDPSSRAGLQRGRRGGDMRGRGGRGRGSGRGGGRGGFGQPRDGYSLPPQSQQQFPPQHQQPQQQQPPALPNFGFQFPGWSQPPAGQGQQLPIPPPPPPPGWSPQGQGQGQAPAPAQAAPFNNPAFIAALMSQMQTQSGQGHQPWGERHEPPRQ